MNFQIRSSHIAAFACLTGSSVAATIAPPSDPTSIPGVVDFQYDSYYVLGGDHVAQWSSDTDAYSWDHPMLASADPVLGEQTGWTHLTRWVAFTVTEPVVLSLRLEAVAGVMIPDQNDPGNLIAAGDDLVPAFTLWSGFEAQREDGSLGLNNPNGGHRWDNDGDLTTWMDQLTYFAHDGNEAAAASLERTLVLPAGDYTMNIAGHKPGAFDPVGLRDGFTATLATSPVPEPGAAALVLATLGAGLLRRQRKGSPEGH